ncbi:MAG: hypothetical protein R3Y13_05335 [bacterium]
METNICVETYQIWKIIGQIIILIKMVLPLVIIVLTTISFGKAAFSSDDKEIKKSYSLFFRRIMICIVIYFIPLIVDLMFGLVEGFSDTQDEYEVCRSCITSPEECDYSEELEDSNNNYEGDNSLEDNLEEDNMLEDSLEDSLEDELEEDNEFDNLFGENN